MRNLLSCFHTTNGNVLVTIILLFFVGILALITKMAQADDSMLQVRFSDIPVAHVEFRPWEDRLAVSHEDFMKLCSAHVLNFEEDSCARLDTLRVQLLTQQFSTVWNIAKLAPYMEVHARIHK